MSADLVIDAVIASNRVRAAHTTPGLERAVSQFVQVLGSVPDEQPQSLSSDEARVLQALSEGVIERIEEQVAEIVSTPRAQPLVNAIYEIRRLLEEARIWRHHFAVARHV